MMPKIKQRSVKRSRVHHPRATARAADAWYVTLIDRAGDFAYTGEVTEASLFLPPGTYAGAVLDNGAEPVKVIVRLDTTTLMLMDQARVFTYDNLDD